MIRMVEDREVRAICQAAIKELLNEHVQSPFLNMREADFRASLFGKLRCAFPDLVPVALLDRNGNSVVVMNQEKSVTSLVHAEVALVSERHESNDLGVSDLAILCDRKSCLESFTIKRGPTDVLKILPTDDVGVVIEIKAGPTCLSGTNKAINKDIEKLKRLLRCAPHVHCFLVIIDKALSLGVGSGEDEHDAELIGDLEQLLDDNVDHDSIEVWYLGGKPPLPKSRGLSN